ncbi:hypothetical protein TFLX_02440 [Thermoflexales bacterium]|nr:hypothetical protein TFLX_02440 [Thermoflexales bacterium]
MQVYRNDQFIQRRAKLGRYFNFAGMGVLLLGLIINLNMRLEGLLLSVLALIVGFTLYQVGMYYTLRFGRPDRPDQVLVKALKGFDNRYHLFQFTSPAGNVLVTPNACFAFTIKMQGKGILYRQGKWQHQIGWQRFFLWLASDSLGNPSTEAASEARALQRYLAKKLPGVEVPIQPVIVFGSPTAIVDAADSPIPALHYKKLKDWLRGPGKPGALGAEAREQIIGLLSPPSAIVESSEDEEQSVEA